MRVDEDFAHAQSMPQRSGLPRYGDVYSKADQYGIWFIKFEFADGVTLIMSCHEAEHPIMLADGRTLRKKS